MDYKKHILKIADEFENSSTLNDYKVLKNKNSMMEICGIHTREIAHSAFLKWFFCSKELLRLPCPPIVLLLQLYVEKHLYVERHSESKVVNDSAYRLIKDIIEKRISSIKVKGSTEVTTNENKRVDIELKVTCINPDLQLLICIENKINHSEKNQQCENYYRYYERTYKNDEKIFIFLSPNSSNGTKNKHFVHLLYQDIYDSILNRIIREYSKMLSSESRYYITDYMRTLTSINNMSTPIVKSDKYEKILSDVYDKYRDLFFASINANGTDDEKKALEKATGFNTRYIVRQKDEDKGSAWGYTKMVNLVIKVLAKNYSSEELVSQLGEITVVKSIDKCVITTKDNKGASSRYSSSKVRSSVDNATIWISNQWNLNKADSFIELVQEKYPEIKIERYSKKKLSM